MASEANLQAAAVRALRANGCLAVKQSSYGSYGTRGWPDYLVLMPGGCSMWIEFKAPGQRPTPLQITRFEALRELGHHVYVCHSKQEALDAWAKEVER